MGPGRASLHAAEQTKGKNGFHQRMISRGCAAAPPLQGFQKPRPSKPACRSNQKSESAYKPTTGCARTKAYMQTANATAQFQQQIEFYVRHEPLSAFVKEPNL
eukprot:scaffold90255_cov14-Tisochrysis_lutea.AAC.2